MTMERTFLGISSGPAADGVDVALVRIDGEGPAMRVTQLDHLHKLYPEGERQRIAAFSGGKEENPRFLAELNRDLAIAAAATARMLLEQTGVAPGDITVAGWSRQLISYERPAHSNPLGAILEVGSPALLAARLNLPVVSGFAEGDLAAGGSGGPVTAWSDWVLFRDERLCRVTVHLGGLATLTFLPAGADPVDVVSYDVGPGTIVLDRLIHKMYHKLYDADGAMSSAGRAHPELVNEMLTHPYFQQEPPKRTSPAEWQRDYVLRLEHMAEKHKVSGADLLASVAEFTAGRIAHAVTRLTERPHEIILTGGGALNIHLAGTIRKTLSPTSTYTVEKYGYSLQSKQAICHAILAAARWDGVSAHCPWASGASRPMVLGSITLP